jgi:hypothetical protein
MGFDNAHSVPARGGQYKTGNVEHDHWHRTGDDPGRPYQFSTAEQLVLDFFGEVSRILGDLGLNDAVIGESTLTERKEP